MIRQTPISTTTYPDGRSEAVQPTWRQDFPIDSAQDRYVARRDFTKFLVLTSLGLTVGQFWILIQNLFRRRGPQPAKKQIARLEEVPVGGVASFHYPAQEDNCLLLRPDANTLLAYDQKCTHLSCAVVPELDKNQLHCPCHNGCFDLSTGRPLAGPPRRPLPRIQLEVRDGVVYATGVEVRTQ
jgi:nitrite reductase/ring-hydroxylating ferredoxin subunit